MHLVSQLPLLDSSERMVHMSYSVTACVPLLNLSSITTRAVQLQLLPGVPGAVARVLSDGGWHDAEQHGIQYAPPDPSAQASAAFALNLPCKHRACDIITWIRTSCACAVLGKVEGQGTLWHGHVTAVTVASDCRRLGLATKLMNILENTTERVYAPTRSTLVCSAPTTALMCPGE